MFLTSLLATIGYSHCSTTFDNTRTNSENQSPLNNVENLSKPSILSTSFLIEKEKDSDVLRNVINSDSEFHSFSESYTNENPDATNRRDEHAYYCPMQVNPQSQLIEGLTLPTIQKSELKKVETSEPIYEEINYNPIVHPDIQKAKASSVHTIEGNRVSIGSGSQFLTYYQLKPTEECNKGTNNSLPYSQQFHVINKAGKNPKNYDEHIYANCMDSQTIKSQQKLITDNEKSPTDTNSKVKLISNHCFETILDVGESSFYIKINLLKLKISFQQVPTVKYRTLDSNRASNKIDAPLMFVASRIQKIINICADMSNINSNKTNLGHNVGYQNTKDNPTYGFENKANTTGIDQNSCSHTSYENVHAFQTSQKSEIGEFAREKDTINNRYLRNSHEFLTQPVGGSDLEKLKTRPGMIILNPVGFKSNKEIHSLKQHKNKLSINSNELKLKTSAPFRFKERIGQSIMRMWSKNTIKNYSPPSKNSASDQSKNPLLKTSAEILNNDSIASNKNFSEGNLVAANLNKHNTNEEYSALSQLGKQKQNEPSPTNSNSRRDRRSHSDKNIQKLVLQRFKKLKTLLNFKIISVRNKNDLPRNSQPQKTNSYINFPKDIYDPPNSPFSEPQTKKENEISSSSQVILDQNPITLHSNKISKTVRFSDDPQTDAIEHTLTPKPLPKRKKRKYNKEKSPEMSYEHKKTTNICRKTDQLIDSRNILSRGS